MRGKEFTNGGRAKSVGDRKSDVEGKSVDLGGRRARKGPGSIDRSMQWLQGLSSIVIDKVKCPKTAEEFISYEYERNREGEILSGYPDANNHHIDACRYATESIWKAPGQKGKSDYTPMWNR